MGMTYADEVRNFQEIVAFKMHRHGSTEAEARAFAVQKCGVKFADVPTDVKLFTQPSSSTRRQPTPTPRLAAPTITYTTPHGAIVAGRISAGDTLEQATRFADHIMGGGVATPAQASAPARDRAVIASELDALVTARAARDGVSRNEGYRRVLAEPEGRKLYAEHYAAPEPARQAAPSPTEARKSDLDRKAEALAASERIGLAQAYDRIMRTPEGARLYREHRAAMVL